MSKRGIDTPAKDDPNRKKPRQESPEEEGAGGAELPKSKSAPAAAQKNVSKSTQPQKTAVSGSNKGSTKSKSAVAPASVLAQKKTKPAAPAGRPGLLEMIRSGSSAAKKPEVTNKNEKVSDKKTKEPVPSPTKSRVTTKPTSEEENTKEVAVELHNNRSLWGLGIVAALGLMNVASVTHLVSEQSRHNIAQMRCHVENEKLNQDLSRNNGVISVLKSGLDAAENQLKSLEQAQHSKMKSLQERSEQHKKGGVLSEEEKKTWAEKKKSLVDKRNQLLDDFNIWLSKLDEVDAME